jgi:uncharacterized membrane protein YphA (DoxX/SURF4 family)
MNTETNETPNDGGQTKPIKKPSIPKALLHGLIALVLLGVMAGIAAALQDPASSSYQSGYNIGYKMGQAGFFLFIAVTLISYFIQKFRFDSKNKKQ